MWEYLAVCSDARVRTAVCFTSGLHDPGRVRWTLARSRVRQESAYKYVRPSTHGSDRRAMWLNNRDMSYAPLSTIDLNRRPKPFPLHSLARSASNFPHLLVPFFSQPPFFSLQCPSLPSLAFSALRHPPSAYPSESPLSAPLTSKHSSLWHEPYLLLIFS